SRDLEAAVASGRCHRIRRQLDQLRAPSLDESHRAVDHDPDRAGGPGLCGAARSGDDIPVPAARGPAPPRAPGSTAREHFLTIGRLLCLKVICLFAAACASPVYTVRADPTTVYHELNRGAVASG